MDLLGYLRSALEGVRVEDGVILGGLGLSVVDSCLGCPKVV